MVPIASRVEQIASLKYLTAPICLIHILDSFLGLFSPLILPGRDDKEEGHYI